MCISTTRKIGEFLNVLFPHLNSLGFTFSNRVGGTISDI